MSFFIKKFTFKPIVFIKLYYAIIFSFFPNIIFAQEEQNYYKNDNHVNILMYHRFGEENYPSTNIKMNQFLDHIEELKKSKYNIISLQEAIQSFKNKSAIPDRSVAITIDDAYLSVFKKAWPILKKNNFTFTLFVSTDVIDNKFSKYMSWNQIRELMDHGVNIGSQTKSHPHMHRMNEEQIMHELTHSNKRFIEELGIRPTLFAYPYGEYDLKTIKLVQEIGFTAAFGQHSGVAHPSAGLYQLPRFAMNENYGGLERLKLAINALPIIVKDISPSDPFIKNNPPNFGFTISPFIKSNNIVRCFASNNIQTDTSRVGKHRIEVRLKGQFPRARGRINCTMEAINNRWRWFGKQFVTK